MHRRIFTSVVCTLILVLAAFNMGTNYRVKADGFEPEIYKVAEIGITEEAEDYLKSVGIILDVADYIKFSFITVKNDGESFFVKVLSIIHDAGGYISTTTLTSFSNDDEVFPVDIPLYVSNSLLSETRENNWQSSITISGTNYFTCHWYNWDSYYKPYTVEVWYTGSSQPSRISASFQTEGELVDANHNHVQDDYVYSINVAQTLPTSGIHYQTVFPLGNDRTIRYTGMLGSGMWLYFNWHVNSTTYEWTVSAMPTPS